MIPPNVLLITLDTLRADMLGCYGYPQPITPHIDRLAARGVRFEQAISGGSWTQAAFPPILTSTYASMYGGCLGPLSLDRPSPVAALSKAGYDTAAFSTSPLLSHAYGYDRGFHTFEDLDPGESDPFLRRLRGGQRLLYYPLTHRLLGRLGLSTRPARLYVSGDQVTKRALQWLDSAVRPFFAWVHYMDVHWPYHREEHLTEPAAIAEAWRDLVHMHGVNWKDRAITPAQRDHYFRLYEQAVRYADSQVGRLLDKLSTSGRLQDTVVILLSDHGEEFLERRKWGHFETNLHDEILRVPLLIAGPGLPAGCAITRQVSVLDIMPTVLDLSNLRSQISDLSLEGQSLRPLWDLDAGEYTSDIAIGEMWRDHRHIIAVRACDPDAGQTFKYIWDSREPDAPRLYELHADPNERSNVLGAGGNQRLLSGGKATSGCRAVAEQARRLQQLVDAHRQRAAAFDDAAQPQPDAELHRRLRDLGYVE